VTGSLALIWPAMAAAFLASLVEAVEALTIVLAVATVRGWRPAGLVGPYAGLTTRRYASSEIDWTGRISKCGDKMLRSYLYEAANVLLTRVAKWSARPARPELSESRSRGTLAPAPQRRRCWHTPTRHHFIGVSVRHG
jgi:transposase